jgi:hypothetical protein
LTTQVTGLVKGYYAFELTVTDSLRLETKAYVRIVVVETTVGQNEIVFRDLRWSCPWECSVAIQGISALIPANNTVTVFVKRDSSNNWMLAANNWDMQGYDYVFQLSNGDLYITSLSPNDNGADTPDIKVTY